MHTSTRNRTIVWSLIGVAILGNVAGYGWNLYERFVWFDEVLQQTGISDMQFLRSMIPHHSSAILMCERAPIQDQEIRILCETIIETQQEEINQMEAIMQRLENAE